MTLETTQTVLDQQSQTEATTWERLAASSCIQEVKDKGGNLVNFQNKTPCPDAVLKFFTMYNHS